MFLHFSVEMRGSTPRGIAMRPELGLPQGIGVLERAMSGRMTSGMAVLRDRYMRLRNGGIEHLSE